MIRFLWVFSEIGRCATIHRLGESTDENNILNYHYRTRT